LGVSLFRAHESIIKDIVLSCKIAAASIVLNNALCFLKNKFGKSGIKPLKSTVLDFYDVEALSGAKRQLISDVKDLNVDIAIPHVPERREGDNKAVRIVDDMFTLLTSSMRIKR